MGRSLSSNHIYNIDKLTTAQFQKKLTDMLRLKGYSTAIEDDAELCYSLVFSQDRKWVTILSEDSGDVRKNAADLAKSLDLQVLSVELVDSDFAELTLFDKNGTAADSMFLGEPYFDEYPEPSPMKWQTMLGIDWSKVEKIKQNDHTFAEDALREFGEVIGCENMLVEFGNDSAVRLCFKKAGKNKLTLNGAFKKYFGNLLEPMGFTYIIINKRPFFLKLINNEILQAVYCKPQPTRKVGYKEFEIKFFISPLYRRNIPNLDFQNDEKDICNLSHLLVFENEKVNLELAQKIIKYHTELWQTNITDFNDKTSDFIDEILEKISFQYTIEYFKGFDLAVECAKIFILPRFKRTMTLKQCVEYYYINHFYSIRPINLDDFDNVNMTYYNASLSAIVLGEKLDLSRHTKEPKFTDIRDSILDNEELKEKAFCTAETFRNNNLKVLKNLGLDLQIEGNKEK